jgi:hypothetical protein
VKILIGDQKKARQFANRKRINDLNDIDNARLDLTGEPIAVSRAYELDRKAEKMNLSMRLKT